MFCQIAISEVGFSDGIDLKYDAELQAFGSKVADAMQSYVHGPWFTWLSKDATLLIQWLHQLCGVATGVPVLAEPSLPVLRAPSVNATPSDVMPTTEALMVPCQLLRLMYVV